MTLHYFIEATSEAIYEFTKEIDVKMLQIWSQEATEKILLWQVPICTVALPHHKLSLPIEIFRLFFWILIVTSSRLCFPCLYADIGSNRHLSLSWSFEATTQRWISPVTESASLSTLVSATSVVQLDWARFLDADSYIRRQTYSITDFWQPMPTHLWWR